MIFIMKWIKQFLVSNAKCEKSSGRSIRKSDVLLGFAVALIGSAQISTFLVGRIHLAGSVIMTFLYSALFQPMLMHWIWNRNGWMYEFIFLRERVPIKDHGGTLVMHISSSLIGVVGNP